MAVAQYPQFVYGANGHMVIVVSAAHAATLPVNTYQMQPGAMSPTVTSPTVLTALNSAQLTLVNNGKALAAFDPTYQGVRLFTDVNVAQASGLFSAQSLAFLQAHQ